MRLLRYGPPALILLAAAALLGLWQGPRWLDWSRYRPQIERAASAGLGRPVSIAGPIGLTLLPQPTLRAGAVTVGDAGDGVSAGAAALQLQVEPWALLTGRVAASELVLQDATLRLPWPLTGIALPPPGPAGLRIALERSRVQLGRLTITQVGGALTVGGNDAALLGELAGTAAGHAWHVSGRLGRPGSDGAATIDVSLDGQGADAGTSGALHGQAASDGTVTGRIAGHGPDLSGLLPAPAQAWRAEGRLDGGGGLIVADDLAVTIGDGDARGAVALRLSPQIRVDVALAASRLTLDDWLPTLLHPGAVALPMGVDLSAEAAQLDGATLRQMRAGFDIGDGGVTLRPSKALLPGDAALQLWGALREGHFTGGARLHAPDFAGTLTWLQQRAPGLLAPLQPTALPTAELSADIDVQAGTIGLGRLAGDVAGVPVRGTAALQLEGRPAVVADLHLTGPALDTWQPRGTLEGLSRWLAGFDADVTIAADRPTWRGAKLDRLDLSAAATGGDLSVRQADLTGAGLRAALSGRLDHTLLVSDGRFALSAADAGVLAPALPAALALALPLLRGPASIQADFSGLPSRLSARLQADVAGGELGFIGHVSAPGSLDGGVTVRHPGAPLLLSLLGQPGLAAWVGDGPLTLRANAATTAVGLRLDAIDLAAGSLRVGGALAFGWTQDARSSVHGRLAFQTVRLPLPRLRSSTPLPLGVALPIDGDLSLTADQMEWPGSTGGAPASVHVVMQGGTTRLENIRATVLSGALSGTAALAPGDPPVVTADLSLRNAALDGGVTGAALDLSAGRVDGRVIVSAKGYSPSTMLASLAGEISVTAQEGVAEGFDFGRFAAALRPGATRGALLQALKGGSTRFTDFDASANIAAGLLTFRKTSLRAAAGEVSATGSADLANAGLDMSLRVAPALDGAPAATVRVVGPAGSPAWTADLGPALQWLAATPGQDVAR